MTNVYVLKKNGTYAGESENLNEMMLKAQSLEKGSLNFQGEQDYYFAFGIGRPGARAEYEINLLKKKRA